MKIFKTILNLLNFVFSISVLVTLVWFHGFKYEQHFLEPHVVYLLASYGFFVAQFIARMIISGDYKGYLVRNKVEYILFILCALEVVLNIMMNFSILGYLLSYTGIENHNHLYVLTAHGILTILVGMELGKATKRSTIWKLSPPILFVLSFVVLIVMGSSLLMLPEMSINGESLNFVDALFTSTSANCVTGLTVVETATHFSTKGQILIMILIQLGGLNMIAFATYFISFYRLRVKSVIAETTFKQVIPGPDNLETKKLIKRVIWSTIFIEFVGAIVLYNQIGLSTIDLDNQGRVFHAVFHSISAFNNAGFTLYENGFSSLAVNTNFSMHITISVLIILGGLGFVVIHDLFNLKRTFDKRKRRSIHLQSKIALISSVVLILTGMIVFYFGENDSISHLNESDKWITAFFQSVTTRTAGFNTVSFSSLSTVFFLFAIILMFIGASSGSTGGGIKTSTFSVLILSTIKKKDRKINYGNSFLNTSLVAKALRILIYSIIIITMGSIILMISDPNVEFQDLFFEEVSAFATVGLSTGITADLSITGKTVIIVTMFIGKIGPIALAQALVANIKISEEKNDQDIMIG